MRLIHDTAAEEWHIQRRSWEARHPCEPEPPDEEPPPRSPHNRSNLIITEFQLKIGRASCRERV